MTKSERIRQFAFENYIQPARSRGEKTAAFTSSDIHKGMGLTKRFPMVCSAIDAQKFQDHYAVILVKRDGPKQSSTVRWVFEV